MKRTILLLFLLMPVFLFAQKYPTGKGTFRSGGGFSSAYMEGPSFNTFELTLTPKLGYFISDEILVGFTSTLAFKYDTSFTTGLRLAPEFKYFYKISPSSFILGNVSTEISRAAYYKKPDAVSLIGSNADYRALTKNVVYTPSVSFGPGFAYFFSRRVGFEFDLLWQQYLKSSDFDQNQFTFNGGVLINILTIKDKIKENRRKKYELDENEE